MGLPQEKPSSGAREVQTTVTADITSGTIFELTPGGKPAIYRGIGKTVASVSAPARIAASVDFTVELDVASDEVLAAGDTVDYDIASKAAVPTGEGDFALGRVIIAKPDGQTRVLVDTSETTAAAT